MENASKALIMAGAVLIALLIISLGIAVFQRMSNTAKDSANMDKQEIANFNSKLTPYVGENVNGAQVNSLITLVISLNNSAVSSGDPTKAVSITYPLETGGENTIELKNGSVTGLDKVKRVKTGAGVYYNVNASYGNSGLINKIKVTAQ